MASKVEICNRALIRLGEKTITSLTEDTTPAKLCNILYDQVRKELLRLHPWNFAIARADLAQYEDGPEFGYLYYYAIPSDCIRVLELDDINVTFKIEGSKLLSDSDEVLILYIKDEEDVTKFDSLFSTCLALKLGVELSYALSGTANITTALQEEYNRLLREAKLRDGQEGTIDQFSNYTWVTGRYS